jgi:phosphohistidine phosphatase
MGGVGQPKETREIWILRHAEAEPGEGAAGDARRRLTAAGEAAATALGRALAARGLRAARVVTSPLVRARQTATLAAGAGLAPAVPLEEDRRLAPGGDARSVAEEALDDGRLPALLVGHNPSLEDLVRALAGATVALGTGAFVRIAFEGRHGRVLPD